MIRSINFSPIARYNDDISKKQTVVCCVYLDFFLPLHFRLADVKIFYFYGRLQAACGYLTNSKMLKSNGEAKTTTWCGDVAPHFRPLRLSAHYLLKLDIDINYYSH